MKDKKRVKIAISIGDINGIGLELAIKNHDYISTIASPIYCINQYMLSQAYKLCGIEKIKNFDIFPTKGEFDISPGINTKEAGLYSYNSFQDAISLVKNGKADAICTMPINKNSWNMANINYIGHTDMLRDIFKKDAIMMMGCDKLFVALYTEHIALKDVPKEINKDRLKKFFHHFYNCVKDKNPKIGVLALNPHASDGGIIGDEEIEINKAADETNQALNKDIFSQALVPDVAFVKQNREKFDYFIAMYHDIALSPLKALYFEEVINISLNLPILRTSVGHGTAFDKAYKNIKLSNRSYINAIRYIKEHFDTCR
ncbi:MAG: 4-hydroxythreonine-4-phosphate dehydrogenase [Campylobacteraceae bacterium 4484_166]|nr:MAG: 4-hydroxythreonine-4-phosphate dehydrogenase [Campylobacteraceae bacterium 4484_166]